MPAAASSTCLRPERWYRQGIAGRDFGLGYGLAAHGL